MSQAIRIMHVISGLDQGGAEAMLVRLLRELDKDSFSQSVVSLTTRGIYGDSIEASGVPLLTLGMTGFSAAPRSVRALRRAIRLQRPAIVQTWLYHADLLGLLAARSAGDASVAWNVRCAGLGPRDVPASTLLLTRVLARMSASPDAVLFNSIAGLEAHRLIGYRPRRSEVIPNGFDLNERRPDDAKRADFRAEMGVDNETFLVGMIGRAHRMKDQSTFLAAAGRLKGMGRPIRFVLVGLHQTWDNSALVKDIDQYGLRDHVELLGIRQDIPRVMSGLDCLVSTSTSEGFPNVLGEAMATGVPCVATDAGDSRLIVGTTGTILPVGDVAGVVAGVSQLMDAAPEERRRRSEQCRRRIAEHFELTHIASRYADFYRELAARRTGSAAAGRRRSMPTLSAAVVTAAPQDEAAQWPRQFAAFAAHIDRQRARARYHWVWRLGFAAALYLAVFHTPLVWMAGDYLTLRQPPRPAGAIVVFSGNGESTYINAGYQRRARDAARYYKAGYAPLLIVSSGITQTFAEVEMIKALLLSQGVPESALRVVTRYPRSTLENVEIVDDDLRRLGIKSILFITAPYHSRRASLIWKKVAPDVTVTTVPVVDSPPSEPQWTASSDQIRAIGYEYLAIAYNRWKGWL